MKHRNVPAAAVLALFAASSSEAAIIGSVTGGNVTDSSIFRLDSFFGPEINAQNFPGFFDERRGVAEFDLSLVTDPLPNANITLFLPDSGGGDGPGLHLRPVASVAAAVAVHY